MYEKKQVLNQIHIDNPADNSPPVKYVQAHV